jgi:hypothetical protein
MNTTQRAGVIPQTGTVHAITTGPDGRDGYPRCNKPGAVVRVLARPTDAPITCKRCLVRVDRHGVR